MTGGAQVTYIVLDLEWSQPVCKEKTRICGTKVLQVEIIQIGAVAVTDGVISKSVFSEYVRPKYYTEIKGKIKKLTGITKNDLKDADELDKVLVRFKKWCDSFGKTLIATWGPDDIPTLKGQCDFFGYDIGWLPGWFNLQPIMTRQYDIDRPQITLQAAVDITGVGQQELDYHSAINDAYYTALVLTKLKDIPQEIEWQKKVDAAHANPFVSICQQSQGNVKTARMNCVPRTSLLNRYVCPICGKPATLKGRLVWVRPMNYMAVVHCSKHSVKVTVNFEKCAEGGYIWTKKYTLSDNEDEEKYASLIMNKKATVKTAGNPDSSYQKQKCKIKR